MKESTRFHVNTGDRGEPSRLSRAESMGFTLLEVLIALAILAVSLMILVSAQSNAARMTVEADRILIGTMLAKRKLADTEIALEALPGFSEQDSVRDEGDFRDLFSDRYSEFTWETEVKKLDIRNASTGSLVDLLGLSDMMEGNEGEESALPGLPNQETLANMVNLDEVSEQLARYIREVHVTVRWDDGNGGDSVTLTTHVIKPNGPQFFDEGETPVPGAAGATGASPQGMGIRRGMGTGRGGIKR